jgi:hypothetical protein
MSANRAFRLTFAAAVILEIARLLPIGETINTVGFWTRYALLLAFGFLAARGGSGYRYALARTWFFVGLWLAFGVVGALVDTTLFRSEMAPTLSPDKRWLAFGGYVFATILLLPIAFAASALGVLAARLFSKLWHDPSRAS